MKRKFIILLFAVVAAATVLFSCRKDVSSLDLNKISGLVIDTTGNGALSVFQFERLVVKPTLKTDLPASDLRYQWRINLAPNDTTSQLIGNARDLDFEVRFKPNVSGKFHHLTYTVTDTKTGLQYIMSWPVTVKNNIGEGLVIAHTDDQTNTDLGHIMSPEVTADFSEVSVKKHVYSSINFKTIPGLVKQMTFTRVFGVDALFAITNQSITRINTLDYAYGGMNNDLFFGSSSSYKPQALGQAFQCDLYVGDGKLTGTFLGASRKFALPFDFKFVVPDHVAINYFSNNSDYAGSYEPPVRVNYYDEVNGHFVYQPSVSSFGDNKMHKYPAVSGQAFDPASLPNKINLAAGINSERGFMHVLKDKTSGKIELYVFDGGIDDPNGLIVPAPKAVYDLSVAPGINDATKFVILDDQKVLYYATANKIYAMMYSTTTPVFEERYAVPAGEQLTTLQIYRQHGYPYEENYIGTHNKQLVMSTFGTEGKVYLLPMKNIGLGTIDQTNIKTFTGFGRITAIITQK